MIGIINYRVGNLLSLKNAFDKIGVKACVLESPQELSSVDKLVLPGVGAYGAAVENLHAFGFFDPLLQLIKQKMPILGICVGMQLLFEEGMEHGTFQGLGCIRGQVVRLQGAQKIPQIGWNQVEHQSEHKSSLLAGIQNQSWFYFVHSYICLPTEQAVSLGQTEYGQSFCSVVQQSTVCGVQFHPEKSQSSGLQLLRNFCHLA